MNKASRIHAQNATRSTRGVNLDSCWRLFGISGFIDSGCVIDDQCLIAELLGHGRTICRAVLWLECCFTLAGDSPATKLCGPGQQANEIAKRRWNGAGPAQFAVQRQDQLGTRGSSRGESALLTATGLRVAECDGSTVPAWHCLADDSVETQWKRLSPEIHFDGERFVEASHFVVVPAIHILLPKADRGVALQHHKVRVQPEMADVSIVQVFKQHFELTVHLLGAARATRL